MRSPYTSFCGSTLAPTSSIHLQPEALAELDLANPKPSAPEQVDVEGCILLRYPSGSKYLIIIYSLKY